MKKESEIKEQLKEVYKYRLALRVERKMKECCKNCVNSSERLFHLGEFGDVKRCVCRRGIVYYKGCPDFNCIWNLNKIEDEMIEDIKDPQIAGSKEPKIAALMWVLHDNVVHDKENNDSIPNIELAESNGSTEQITTLPQEEKSERAKTTVWGYVKRMVCP